MKKHIQNIATFLLLVICMAAKQAVAEDDKDLVRLKNALEASRYATFSCTLKDPELLWNFQGAATCKYEQYSVKVGELFRKMIFLDKDGNEICILLENPDGCYAFSVDEWMELREIHLLRYVESLWQLPETEWSLLSCESKEVTVGHGRKALHIQASTTKDMERLPPTDCEGFRPLEAQMKDNQSDYYKDRPFKRVFTIDERTRLVLSRTDYNRNGQKVFERAVTDVDFVPSLSKHDFWPGKLKKGDPIVFLYNFSALHAQKMQAMKTKPMAHAPRSLHLGRRIMDFLIRHGLVIFLSVGVVSILAAWFLRRKMNS